MIGYMYFEYTSGSPQRRSIRMFNNFGDAINYYINKFRSYQSFYKIINPKRHYIGRLYMVHINHDDESIKINPSDISKLLTIKEK